MARYITPLAAALVLAASAAASIPASAQPHSITLYGTVQRIGGTGTQDRWGAFIR